MSNFTATNTRTINEACPVATFGNFRDVVSDVTFSISGPNGLGFTPPSTAYVQFFDPFLGRTVTQVFPVGGIFGASTVTITTGSLAGSTAGEIRISVVPASVTLPFSPTGFEDSIRVSDPVTGEDVRVLPLSVLRILNGISAIDDGVTGVFSTPGFSITQISAVESDRFSIVPNATYAPGFLESRGITPDLIQGNADPVFDPDGNFIGVNTQLFSAREQFCFPGDTLITLSDGSQKAISKIELGDKVLSFNFSGELVASTVTTLFKNITNQFITLSFADNRPNLNVTPGHKFLTVTGEFVQIEKIIKLNGGYNKPIELISGDGNIVTAFASRIDYCESNAKFFEESRQISTEIQGASALKHQTEIGWATYNFEVEDTHTYIAGDVRVHNNSILSFVEFGDSVIAVDETFTNAVITRDIDGDGSREIVILDGDRFGSPESETFLNAELVFTPNNPNADVEALLDQFIQQNPEAVENPFDPGNGNNPGDGIPSDDIFEILTDDIGGTFTRTFGGVPVPSLEELVAAGATGGANGLLQSLLGPLAGSSTSLDYASGSGDVSITPSGPNPVDILLFALGLPANAEIIPGPPLPTLPFGGGGGFGPSITLGNLINQLPLPNLNNFTVDFGGAITSDDVTQERVGNDLVFTITNEDGSTNTLTLNGIFVDGNANEITAVNFGDGSSSALSAIVATPVDMGGGTGTPDDPVSPPDGGGGTPTPPSTDPTDGLENGPGDIEALVDGLSFGSGFVNGTAATGGAAGNNTFATAVDISDEFSLDELSILHRSTEVPHVVIQSVGDGTPDLYTFTINEATQIAINIGIADLTDPNVNVFLPLGAEDRFFRIFDVNGRVVHSGLERNYVDVFIPEGIAGSLFPRRTVVYDLEQEGQYFISLETIPRIGRTDLGTNENPIIRPVTVGREYSLQISIGASIFTPTVDPTPPPPPEDPVNTEPEVIEASDNGGVLGGTSADNIINGGLGDDVIFPNGGSNTINGGEGLDTVIFEGLRSDYTLSVSNDVITVTGNGEINALTNIEQIVFDAPGTDNDVSVNALELLANQVDIVSGTDSNDVIGGNDGNDIINAGNGDDVIFPDGGNNIINGGNGLDTVILNGSFFDHTLTVAGQTITVTGLGRTNTLTNIEQIVFDVAGNAEDVSVNAIDLVASQGASLSIIEASASGGLLGGTDLDDIILGGAGEDVIFPNSGSNIINGRGGLDTVILNGSFFDHTISVSGDQITVTGFGETQRLSNIEQIVFDVEGNAEDVSVNAIDLVASQGASLSVIEASASGGLLGGTDLDDIILGGAGEDVIFPNGGSNTINGRGGLDTVILNGLFSDHTISVDGDLITITGLGETQRISNVEQIVFDVEGTAQDVSVNAIDLVASQGASLIEGTWDDNNLKGTSLNEIIFGGGGNDIIEGFGGADIIDGGEGFDVVSYYDSFAGVSIDLQQNTAFGGDAEGDQFINIEDIDGSFFADDLAGNDQANFINGHENDDTLRGRAGDDQLNGNDGNDIIIGDEGNDTLIGGLGADIFIFNNLDGDDTINDFFGNEGDQIEFTASTGLHSFADVIANTFDTADGAIINFGDDESVLLENVKADDLQSDNFIFS